MDITMNRGNSHMGFYGPLAMGEFPSYDPREDRAIPSTQMVIASSHGSEECDKRKTPKQEQIYGEHKPSEVYETWANILQMVDQEEYQNIMKQVIMGNDEQARKAEQEMTNQHQQDYEDLMMNQDEDTIREIEREEHEDQMKTETQSLTKEEKGENESQVTKQIERKSIDESIGTKEDIKAEIRKTVSAAEVCAEIINH